MSRKRRNQHNQHNSSPAVATAAAPEPAQADFSPRGSMALWVATPFGVLMPALRPSHTYNAAEDVRAVQVRSREKATLDKFRELYAPELGESLHFDHDYPWKAYITHAALAAAVGRMVLDIDSVKFKPLADGPKGVPSLSRKLHSIYNSWWSTYLHHGDGTSSFDVRPRTSRPGAGTARTSSWTGWDEWVSDRKPAGSHNHVGSGRTYSQYEIKHGVRCRAVGHAMFGVDETTGKPRCTDCGYVSKEDTGLPTPVFPAGVTDLPLPKFGYGLGFGSPADYEEALPTRFCVECGLEEWEPDSEQPCNTSPDGKHVWDEDEGLSEALMGH